MAKDDYLPRKEGLISAWLNNYKIKLSQHGTVLGLTPAEVTKQEDMCSEIITEITNSALMRNAMKSQNAKKKAVIKKNLTLIRKTIQRMKVSPHYATPAGKDMGAIGTDRRVTPAEVIPQIKASTFPKVVRIRWKKKGIDGVKIHTRLTGETEWKVIGWDFRSPFFDTRPLADGKTPESREYMAQALIKDEVVGQQSQTVTVVFGG